MAAGGTPGNVDLGPGRLYYAPLGTAEPTNCSTALPSAWIALGYTDQGTEFTFDITSEAVEVAEELEPVSFEQTARRTRFTVAMAEMTKKRLALALGAGSGETDDSSVFSPPAAGSITEVMFVWDSLDTPGATNRRWLFRRCSPSGTITTARRKAPQKALIQVTFDCARPSDGSAESFSVFPNASGQV